MVPVSPQSAPPHSLQTPQSVQLHAGMSQVPCSSSFGTGHPKLPSSCNARFLNHFWSLMTSHVMHPWLFCHSSNLIYRALVLERLGIQLRTGENMSFQNGHPILFSLKKTFSHATTCTMCTIAIYLIFPLILTAGIQSRVLVLVPGPPQSSPEHTLQSPHSVNWHSGISQVPCSSSFATGHPKLPSS